ncbi:hypothetical protein KC640_03545 [Candidatus Dojkabacteria bacterium]|uniref:Uncharacterized protein n=1 Tax=Candidatus Dojkabacteria bacterium TaxID=2099670 RepID=A0A955I6E1_9BACT|nr:hypothetical protein [Candidatus Dojkabacteria bacterium]
MFKVTPANFARLWRQRTILGIIFFIGVTMGMLLVALLGVQLTRVESSFNPAYTIDTLHPVALENLEIDRAEILATDRQQIIDRVRAFFERYGSPMAPYVEILVDQSYACGGNYRVLVGIAGSESGLGKVPYKLYNPFGYLNGVQYASWEEALTDLSCKISQQHISKCGEDLRCLALRYAGPSDDLNLFISKVAWFMGQV